MGPKMKNKNLLLGYGETLTREVILKRGGGSKNKPYTYEENKPVIMRDLQELVKDFNDIPEKAKPNGEAVAKVTLHPAFLAKSYFPVDVFKHFSLRSIGSKSVKIRPRKNVSSRGKAKEEHASACIYVSGKVKSFEALYAAMDKNKLKAGRRMRLLLLKAFRSLNQARK